MLSFRRSGGRAPQRATAPGTQDRNRQLSYAAWRCSEPDTANRLLDHVLPLGWAHILLTDDYLWLDSCRLGCHYSSDVNLRLDLDAGSDRGLDP